MEEAARHEGLTVLEKNWRFTERRRRGKNGIRGLKKGQERGKE
jgi:hypothetical protein